MIRLLLLLCVGLYITAMVFGEDRGQKRYGLMMADSLPERKAIAPARTPAPAAKPVFIPAQPVMAKPATPQPPEQPQTVALPIPEAEPEIAPDMMGGTLFTVATSQANVRMGPGRSFAVISSLTRGEQVLVVPEAQPIEGWSRIRIEGDGIEGYISTPLLIRN